MDALNRRKHDNSNTYDKTIKNKLVMATLPHAVFDGFGKESLINGANDCEIDVSIAISLFPKPKNDIPAQWWKILDELTIKYANEFADDMRIRDKISALVKHRIEQLNKFKPCASIAFGQMILPNNIATAGHQLWDSADTIWIAIGDKTPSNDRNYYTKRIILSTVLFASISYWLQDEDGDINEYIERRISDALNLGKVKNLVNLNKFKEFIPYLNHPLKMRD